MVWYIPGGHNYQKREKLNFAVHLETHVSLCSLSIKWKNEIATLVYTVYKIKFQTLHFLFFSADWFEQYRPRFDPWMGKIPWRRKWHPTPVFLPWKFHGQRSLVGYSPGDCKERDVTEWARTHKAIFAEEWQGPLLLFHDGVRNDAVYGPDHHKPCGRCCLLTVRSHSQPFSLLLPSSLGPRKLYTASASSL